MCNYQFVIIIELASIFIENHQMILILQILGVILLAILLKQVVIPYIKLKLYFRTLPQGCGYMGFYPVLGTMLQLRLKYKNYYQFNKAIADIFKGYRCMATNIRGKNMLLFSDPDLASQVYKAAYKVTKTKTLKSILGDFTNGGLFLSQLDQHKKTRKQITQFFNFKFITDKSKAIDEIIRKNLQAINSNQFEQVIRIMNKITSSVIVHCFFCIDQLSQTIEGVSLQRYLTNHFNNQFLKQLSSFARQMFGLKLNKKWNRQNQILNQIISNIVVTNLKQKQDQSQSKGMLKLIYENHEGCHQQKLAAAINEFKVFFFAGTDTSSNLANTCIYYLAKYPEYQAKVRKQIEQVDLQNITPNVGKELIFFNCFISQVQRLYGPGNFLAFREVIQDFYIGDVPCPKGTIITVSVTAIHQSQKYYQKPHEFLPQRWIGFQPKPFTFIPFSSGPRNCIGQHLAMFEVRLILIRILKMYQFQLQPGFDGQFSFMFLPIFKNEFRLKFNRLNK